MSISIYKKKSDTFGTHFEQMQTRLGINESLFPLYCYSDSIKLFQNQFLIFIESNNGCYMN